MLTCDYNGWNDAPEEQRKWFDQHPEIWTGPLEERPMTRSATGVAQCRSRDHQPLIPK